MSIAKHKISFCTFTKVSVSVTTLVLFNEVVRKFTNVGEQCQNRITYGVSKFLILKNRKLKNIICNFS